jgi:hypothetical protein
VGGGRAERRIASGRRPASRSRAGDRAAGPGRGDPAGVSGRHPGRSDRAARTYPAAAAGRLWHVPRADRCGRHSPGGEPRAPAGRRIADRHVGAPQARSSNGPRSRDPRTGGRARRGRPDRPARPRRSRPRCGLHDGRCQPRRGDLGLEHRDRGVDARRARRRPPAATTGNPDRCRHRGVRGVRRAVAIGRPGRRHGGRGAARPRARAAGHRGGRAGLGRDGPAPARSRLGRRRRLPPLRPCDRGHPRLGLISDDATRRSGARPTAALARRDPGRIARRTGGDDTDRAARVRSAVARGAGCQPDRGAARARGDGRRRCGARGRRPGRLRGPVDRRHRDRAAGVGAVRGDGRDGAGRRRAAAREPPARRAV